MGVDEEDEELKQVHVPEQVEGEEEENEEEAEEEGDSGAYDVKPGL